MNAGGTILSLPQSVFEYGPNELKEHEIRLVVLQPLRDVSPRITCRLIHAHYNDIKAPVYKALSYTWGYRYHDINTEHKAILLNGCHLMIGRNLWWALYHLCPPEGSRNLWIDAICINQRNFEERNCQVMMMGKIYSEAQEVLVWLGNEDENSDAAIGLIRKLAHPALLSALSLWNLSRDWSNLHHSLKWFLARPYWKRLWIVQEIVLAKKLTICCGTSRMSWEVLADAFEKSQKPALFSDAKMKSLASLLQQSMPALLERSRQDLVWGRSLISLLHACQDSEASDPRDMIYGLLGITNDSACLEVDYSKTTYELWLNLLYLQNRPPPLSVPSMTFSGDRKRSMYFNQLLWDVLKLPVRSSAAFYQSIPKGVIQLKGIWRDTIMQLGPTGSEIKAARHHAWKIRDSNLPGKTWKEHFVMSGVVPWDLDVLEAMDPLFSHQGALQIFCGEHDRENTAMISTDAFSMPVLSEPLQRKGNISAMTNRHGQRRAKLAVRTSDENAQTTCALLDTTNFEPYNFCSFVMTESGQIGLTSPTAKVGDLICQFRGCDIAVLLRKDKSDVNNDEQQTKTTHMQFLIAGRVMLLLRRDGKPQRREGSNRVFQYSVPDDAFLEDIEVECSFNTRTLASLAMWIQPVVPVSRFD